MHVFAWLLLVGGLTTLAVMAIVALAGWWSDQQPARTDARTFDEHVRTALAALTPDALDGLAEPTPVADGAEAYLRLLCIRPAAPDIRKER